MYIYITIKLGIYSLGCFLLLPILLLLACCGIDMSEKLYRGAEGFIDELLDHDCISVMQAEELRQVLNKHR